MQKKKKKGAIIRAKDELILFILLVLIVLSLLLGILINRNKTATHKESDVASFFEEASQNSEEGESVEEVLQKVSELYTVQASSLKERSNAEELVKHLKLRGYDATIHEYVTDSGNVWYRVDVGRYISRSAARSVGEELVSKKLIRDYVIRELK